VVLLAAEGEPSSCRASGIAAERPTIPAVLAPVAGQGLDGRRLFAFAGIGRPEKFFAMLRRLGVELVGARPFPDHHPFAARDIAELRGAAERRNAGLVTTAKDLVRVPAAARDGIDVLEVEIRWPNPDALIRLFAPILDMSAGNGRDPDRRQR
ncbi:MAG: tetraacyldisaccharide 4'-kinase, partial [Stellaceae bacterium]